MNNLVYNSINHWLLVFIYERMLYVLIYLYEQIDLQKHVYRNIIARMYVFYYLNV